MRRFALVVAVVALLAAGCGDDDDDEGAATTSPTTTETTEPTAEATEVAVTAKDYTFDVPSTIKGGLVEFSYQNSGKEPHFASFAKIAPGKTFDDVKTALATPPSAAPAGPPPFEEAVGLPTADPGRTGKATADLPAGEYALFCTIPSPDGVPHAVKGMVVPVTVTEGPEGELPTSVGTVNAMDFSLNPLPTMSAGKNVVRISNQGKQLHEINLIELATGKKFDDVLAWFNGGQSGPPPAHFLSGVAVLPGKDGTAEFDLKSGSTYALICAIPDFLGDFKPHVTKGMYTATFVPS